MAGLFTELKRRNVFRVGVAYGIVAWLLIEMASVIMPGLHLPDWTLTFLIVLVVAGFPLALILAWAFELTPEGIKRESAVDPAESTTHHTGRKFDFAIIGLLVIALIFVVVDNYILETEPEQAEVAAEQAPVAELVEREKSIAVLPFENQSQDAANEPFTIGIHDDILTQISKIRALKVISRTSVMEYRNTTKNLKTIGQELGAATVLEGGVQRAGDRVRINVQLIDAATDKHLWAETYDRRLTAANIFAIQTEIATAIADALRATLSPEEEDRLATVPTENLAAYEAYLLGKQRLAKLTTAAFKEAVDYFERAIGLDPDFALAHVGLADGYIWLSGRSGYPLEETLSKAQAATDKALALDDRLGEAYNSLAGIKQGRSDYEGAEAAYRRALELNPNYATAYFWYGTLLDLGNLDRLEEALALYRKAVELDPLSAAAIYSVGDSLLFLGRFQEDLAWYEKAIEIDPSFALAYIGIGAHYQFASGQLDEALVWFAKGMSHDPGSPAGPVHMGFLFLDLGDLDRAEYWIERAIELGPEAYWPTVVMQVLHLYRGEDVRALDFGRKAFALASSVWPGPALLRDHELGKERYAEARALYEKANPELLNEDDPKVVSRNWRAATDLALVLSKTGEQERANLLLENSFRHFQTMPRRSPPDEIREVKIYALRGEKQKALAALRRVIDEGWRFFWWYYLKHDPNLESLHDEPEYQAMVAEIEADMATQLARVREMERNGELEPIPELAAE
jgi:TolB-like protein/Tfp pilus assembly protein PilF